MRVPLSELAAVSMRTAVQQSVTKLCGGHDAPVLVLHTFKRRQHDWVPVEHAVEFEEERMAAAWADAVQALLDTRADRPRRLFVVINPYGGSRRADAVWADVAKPLFERARITCDAFRTGFQDHAVELLEQMSWEQFSGYDGIVAVGGDGLFQECLRGVLALRARGGAWRDKARDIRIAQVPAGSTDAVACTINGCRSAATAALHVVLGDRVKLDVLEVRTREGECRYACSTASYGFVGDVLGRSEAMRWMGPVRYDIGGAMTFLNLRSYPVRLWYRPPAAPHPKRAVCCSSCTLCSQPTRHVFDGEASPRSAVGGSLATSSGESVACGEGDEEGGAAARVGGGGAGTPAATAALFKGLHMRGASGFGDRAFLGAGAAAKRASLAGGPATASLDAMTHDAASSSGQASADVGSWFGDLPAEVDGAAGAPPPAAAAGDDPRWRCWEGEISSLMVVVTPTRSDKSKAGIVPHAHLSDGRLHLVIVRKCSRVQFLRFLLSISRKGVDESLDFVEVKEVEAWRLQELDGGGAEPSVWNVDGELMQTQHMSARCHHGLIDVFGRGPECGL